MILLQNQLVSVPLNLKNGSLKETTFASIKLDIRYSKKNSTFIVPNKPLKNTTNQ